MAKVLWMPIVSGGGSTMGAILAAHKSGRLSDLQPMCCIATRDGLGAYDRWCAAGMPPSRYHVIPKSQRRTPEEFSEQLFPYVERYGIELVGLHGCTVLIPDPFTTWFGCKIYNQHPGWMDPVPEGEPRRRDFGGNGMRGLVVHEATRLFMLEYARREEPFTEATAHVAVPGYDRGPLLKTVRMPLFAGDTAASIAARLLPLEHELQIHVLELYLAGTATPYYRNEPGVQPHEYEAHERAVREAIATTIP
ncbi:MAG: hypothetical protein U0514_02010 [Candidatus Andersenbacteria bacterium]